MIDSRQPAIFHIEWASPTVGDECVGFSSKLYILQKTVVTKKMAQSSNKYIFYINTVRKAGHVRKGFVFKRKYEVNKDFMCGYIGKDIKFSCNGVQQSRIQNPLVKMLCVLRTGKIEQTKNVGFRTKDNQIFSYEMTKSGMTFMYYKRLVHSDLINTSSVKFTLTPSYRQRHTHTYTNTPTHSQTHTPTHTHTHTPTHTHTHKGIYIYTDAYI